MKLICRNGAKFRNMQAHLPYSAEVNKDPGKC